MRTLLSVVLVVAVVTTACSAQQPATRTSDYPFEAVILSYSANELVTDHAKYWSLYLTTDGKAQISAYYKDFPEKGVGVMSESVRSDVFRELERVIAEGDQPICASGHIPQFQVVVLMNGPTRIECLPLSSGSSLEQLYELAIEIVRSTSWQS